MKVRHDGGNVKVVVTGSSSGIGHAVWRHLSENGHDVLGLARSDQSDALNRLPAERRGRTRVAVCDIVDQVAVERVVEEVRTTWGGVDALICAAGIQGQIGLAMENDADQWWTAVRTNLFGTYLTIRSFHPLLLSDQKRHAKVICFSGGGATKARPYFSSYACAKAGVVRLVETLAEEWQGDRVDINAVAPGAVLSRMTEEVLRCGPGVAGELEWAQACKTRDADVKAMECVCGLIDYLLGEKADGISGKLISALWDPWERLHEYMTDLQGGDIYCLRRIIPKDRGKTWGDR